MAPPKQTRSRQATLRTTYSRRLLPATGLASAKFELQLHLILQELPAV
jgi:hypothetical protein